MKFRSLAAAFLILAAVSCSQHETVDPVALNANVPSGSDINKTLNVVAPQEWNTFKVDDGLKLLVSLKSDHTVILDDHNVKIYLNRNNEWIPVENQNPHPKVTYIIEPIGTPAFRSAEVIVIPNVNQQSDSVILRIVVSGNIYDNKIMGEQVQAYVDVTLQP